MCTGMCYTTHSRVVRSINHRLFIVHKMGLEPVRILGILESHDCLSKTTIPGGSPTQRMGVSRVELAVRTAQITTPI